MTEPTKNRYQQENEHYIGLIKQAGWRVFVRPGNPYSTQYCYYTDGKVIGYAQWSSGRPPYVGSVHKANRQVGTGFTVSYEITAISLKMAAHCFAPEWAYQSQRLSVVKYKDWDEFHNRDSFTSKLVEV